MAMNRRRQITAMLALCIGAAFLAALVSIFSVVSQPGTAVVIFLYALIASVAAFATGRESTKP
jgi:hypothetical protein